MRFELKSSDRSALNSPTPAMGMVVRAQWESSNSSREFNSGPEKAPSSTEESVAFTMYSL